METLLDYEFERLNMENRQLIKDRQSFMEKEAKYKISNSITVFGISMKSLGFAPSVSVRQD